MIDENRVFRMDEPIPTEGVSIAARPEPGPPLPPHLGRWHKLGLTETTLALAFIVIGVEENGSTADLGEGTTGVYFSVEPDSLKSKKDLIPALQASKLQGEIDAIEQHPNNDPNLQSQQESKWNAETEEWLQTNFGKSTVLHFRDCAGESAKKDYFHTEWLTMTRTKQGSNARANP
jgi:hypothetical protein